MNCFKPRAAPAAGPKSESDPDRVAGCIFCDVSKDRGFDVVYEDADYVAFKDIRPAALHHIQVVPKRHIESIKSMNQDDAPVVKAMQTIGNLLLDESSVPAADRRMGFHIPPFNSVNHLHLHVQATPYKFLRGWKYPVAQPRSSKYFKGYSWFVEVGQAIRILEAGRKVQASAC